jgi:hypothetical protein
MRTKREVEGDGVLQTLRWLRRTPESFMPGRTDAAEAGAELPDLQPHQILRFDVPAIYTALDAQRIARGLSWAQVAREIGGCHAASLTRLATGSRVGFPHVMRIFRRLGRPAAHFIRISTS